MGKKKNKPLIRPWCWYCEREFEDEKVLMQHQKAKHFKCGMCPRRLNTAGGLAVHIQQVHKLEPDNLPRIENALPGRDGYEIEIFGMEGIPAPDVADYKRRKEIELGLSAGSISQPQPKRAKVESRPLTEEELRAQLEAHKALMGGGVGADVGKAAEAQTAVYGAPAQAYAMPPTPAGPSPPIPPFGTPPIGFPGPPPPGMVPPPGMMPPGAPPFPPFGAPGVPPPGFMPPFPPPPGVVPPFPPGGVRPPFPPPPGFIPPGMPPMPPPGIPMAGPPGMSPPPPPSFVPAQQQPPVGGIPGPMGGPPPASASSSGSSLPPPPPSSSATSTSTATPNQQQVQGQGTPPPLTLPDPSLAQTNPEFKKPTELKYADANFSPEEKRARHPKYYFAAKGQGAESGAFAEEPRGKKRARAEDFL